MTQSAPPEKPPHMTQDDKWLAIDDYIVEKFLEADPVLDAAQAAITAYNEHLKEQGLVIVPREPTEKIIDAGRVIFWVEGSYEVNDGVRAAYRAMIQAAEEE